MAVERRLVSVTPSQTSSSQVGRLVGGLMIIASLLLIALVALAFLDVGARGDSSPRPSDGDPGGAVPGTLVMGTVTDADGPVADTRIQVSLWPAEDDTEIGEEVDLFPVKPVRTDEHGRYAVVLPVADVPARYLLSRRIANFDIWLGDAGVAPLSTSARYSKAASWWVDVFDDLNEGPKTIDFDLDSMTAEERSADGRETHHLVEWQ